MSTTSIRLPPKLKARVAAAAKRGGTTEFHEVAEERCSHIAASGKAVPWREMRTYLENRVAGKNVRRPVAKKAAR